MTSKTEKPKATKPEMLHTSDVAKMLHIDAKHLRTVLRANADKSNKGKKYEFSPNDLPRLKKMIEEYDAANKKA